jgi:hypothetical protein
VGGEFIILGSGFELLSKTVKAREFFQNLHLYMKNGAYLLFSYYTDPRCRVEKDGSGGML